MEIIDLGKEHEELFISCLEDWSDEPREAGDHRQRWYIKMKDRGLGVKLAVDDDGVVGGMIQYLPVEQSFVEGRDIYFVNCIWVHGYKQGRGNHQKRGMGKALLQAAEDDVKSRGSNALAAWGIPLPFWMKASWFRKQGYVKVDQQGFFGGVLLWKPFTSNAVPPRWINRKKKPELTSGKVTVTAFLNGWCMAQNLAFERARKATEEFGDRVVFHHIDTGDRANFLEWGITDALYIDGKQVRTGPPPSYEKLRKAIASKVKKL